MQPHDGVRVESVDLSSKRQVKSFIKFHYDVYDGDENWVAPLIVDYLERLDRRKNPYFDHSAVQPFLAFRGDRIVGRITAHENNQHVAYHKEPVGFFGFFECTNDAEVAAALFDAAAGWLKERGLETMRGPASFSVNGDPVGLLVDGFDRPPVVGMPYNPQYYVDLMESAGFQKVKDLLAYHFSIQPEPPRLVQKIADRAMSDPKLTIRNPDMKHYLEEIDRVKVVYNEAWSENWGAVPMTDEEFAHFSKELKLAVEPDLTFIAEYDGRPVGMSMVFHDMNQAMKPARGRLLPFGLLKILAGKRKITMLRLPVLGVMEGYRRRGIDAAFYAKSMEAGVRKGYKEAELSWILEDNAVMNKTLRQMGMTIYKTYRLYDRAIG